MPQWKRPYYEVRTPEHNASYYREKLTEFRKQLSRKGKEGLRQYVSDIKEKYDLSKVKYREFSQNIKSPLLSNADYRRQIANYWEREYKIATGAYDRERKEIFIDNLNSAIEAQEDQIDPDLQTLINEYITTETLEDVIDYLPKIQSIYHSSVSSNDQKQETIDNQAYLQWDMDDRLKLAVLKAAQKKGVKVSSYKDLLKHEFDYDDEDLINEVDITDDKK